MTQDELTKLINEFLPYPSEGQHSALRQFAKLVAQHEREACAKVCEDEAWRCKKIAVETQNKQANASAIEASICASAIRARVQA